MIIIYNLQFINGKMRNFQVPGGIATAPTAAELPRVVNTAGVLYFIYATPSEWYQDGGGFVPHKPATN